MMGDNGKSQQGPVYVSVTGLPLRFHFEWPFQKSTAGADFWYLHADIRLATSEDLHALVAVNLSATLREVLPSLEPRDAEGSIINALRKEVDRKQLEFVKSAKLVPVHFSSRHYSFKHNKWVFEKPADDEILRMIEQKVFWQTKLAGGNAWLGDPTEAQYVDTTTDHVAELGNKLAGQGLIKLERRYATALPALMSQAARFENEASEALSELEKKHAFERG
jgi:hypothetical protein